MHDTRQGTGRTAPAGGDEAGRDPHGRDAEKPSDIPARGWKDVLKRTLRSAKDDNVTLLAAGVAFYALLALVPALVAMVSIYGLVADPQDIERQIADTLAAAPEEVRRLLSTQLQGIIEASDTGLGIGAVIGVATALWAASAGMKHLIEGVNVTYGEQETRGFLKLRGLALLLSIGAIAFVVVAAWLVAVVPSMLADTGLGDAARVLMNVLRWPLLFVAMMVGLAIVYRFGPDRDEPRWRWVSWGAVIATFVWVIGSVLFSIYTANFGKYNETYGSLGAVVVVMLWLLLTAYVVLFGAELNAELEHQTTKDSTEGHPERMGHREAAMADRVGPTADEVSLRPSRR